MTWRDFVITQLTGASGIFFACAFAILAFTAMVWAVKFAIYIWVK